MTAAAAPGSGNDAGQAEIPVHLVQMWLCALCLDGEGGECQTPGCALWINRAPDLPLRDSPFVKILPEPQESAPGQASAGQAARLFYLGRQPCELPPGWRRTEAHGEWAIEVAPGVRVSLTGTGDFILPDGRTVWGAGIAVWAALAAREPDADGVLLSDYLRERGRPGIAAMVEEAERAAREPDAADGLTYAPAYDQLYAALARLACDDWLGTQGYDGDELQRRVEFACDKLAALPKPEPQPAPDLQVAALRAELTELTDNHNGLIEEILLNAGDEYDGDEAAEAIAVRYVRDLEAGTVRKPVDGDAGEQPAPGVAEAVTEARAHQALIAEILSHFGPSGSGHTARVGQVQITRWLQRAGIEQP